VISPHPEESSGGRMSDRPLAGPAVGPRFVDELLLVADGFDVVPGARTRRSRTSAALTWQHLLLADLVALILATGGGVIFRQATGSMGMGSHPRDTVLVMSVFGIMQMAVFSAVGLYRRGAPRLQPSSYADAGPIACGVAVAAFVSELLILVFLGHSDVRIVRESELVAVTAMASLALTITGRSATYLAVGTRRPTRVLIIGSGMVANQVGEYLARGQGAEVVGYVDDDPAPATHVIGKTCDVSEICRRLEIDSVLVSFSRTHPEDLNDALRSIQGRIPIGVVPRFFELMSWRSKMDDLCGLPIVDIAPPSLSHVEQVVKRSFDILVAGFLLVLLLPLFAVVAIAIKWTSRGPVLFRQLRTGRWGKDFTIYKFRTMHLEADDLKSRLLEVNESDGPLFKIRSDPRLTRIGEFLRKTSFDELPQLLNVLYGHMSLVGPRPFVPGESQRIDGWAKRRFEVRPGLTGLWQVSGRSDLSYEDLQRLDYTYVASWSLAWDVKILWQTPGRVLRGLGAY